MPRFSVEVAGAGLARPLGPHTEGGLADWASLPQPQAGGNQRPPGCWDDIAPPAPSPGAGGCRCGAGHERRLPASDRLSSS